MRARDFLREYSREKTANVFGKKLIAAFQKDQGYFSNTVQKYHDFIQGKTLDQIAPEQLTIIPNIVLEMLEGADPTNNKEYVQWLAKVYANEGVKMEDLTSKTPEWLQKYDLYKKKRFFTDTDSKLANIMNLSWRDLWDISIRADFQMKIKQAEEKAMSKGDAELVYENDKVRIIVPKDKEAACYYGQGTQWCTASTQSMNYFNQYNREGPMYILLPKKPQYDGEKYQLHFPSGQFMNEQDHSIDVVELLDMRFGSDLVNFFMEREPVIKDWLVFTPEEVLEPLIAKIRSAVSQHVDEIVSDWEIQDDDWYSYILNKYPGEDGEPDWEKAADYDESYTDWNYDAADFMARINGAIDLTPREVKELAQEVGSGWGADSQEVGDLDKIMAYAIEQTNSRNHGDGGVAEWLHEHVHLRKTDGQWDVSLIYFDKDGKRKEYPIQ